jgi:putative transposase
MTNKYQNKYRIPSARLQNWDYGWNAPYFVTICTQNREGYFGDIVETPESGVSMQLSEIGTIAKKYWNEIPQHFPFVHLDAFVVMPNHVHGIIIIDKNDDGRDNVTVETPKLDVSTTPQPQPQTATASQKWKPATLGVIINQYKRICTINAHKIYADFAWQSRFHDHIIRNNQSFEKIKSYIIKNPLKWNDDKFFFA